MWKKQVRSQVTLSRRGVGYQSMDPQKFDLNLLQVLDALMRESNLTRAGVKLGLSQSTTSYALAKLRKLTGDPLFVKVRSGMEPTEFALRIGPSVREGIRLLTGALEGSGTFDPADCGRTFQILMSDIGELVYLPHLVTRLAAEAPQVNVRVLQLPREQYQEALASGDADIAIGFLPALKTDVYQQRLFDDTYICLVRADHPRVRKTISVAQFSSESHVVVEPAGSRYSGLTIQTSTTTLLERHLAQSGVNRRIALRVPHFMVVPSIIQQTDLVATLPSYVMGYTKTLPRLKTIAFPFDVPGFEIKQFWHARKHADPANRWLRSLVADLFMPAVPTKPL